MSADGGLNPSATEVDPRVDPGAPIASGTPIARESPRTSATRSISGADITEVFALRDTVDERLVSQWRDLAEHSARGFSSRPSYALNWHRELGRGRLAVATLHRGGELVALLPLHARNRFGVRVLRWLGHGLGTLGEPLYRESGDLRALLAALHERGVLLELTHVRADSELLRLLQDDLSWRASFTVDEHCPVIDLPDGVTAVELRSTKTLGQLRRARAKAERESGEVGLEVVASPAELERCWPELVRISRASRDSDPAGRLNLFDGEYADFAGGFLAEEATAGRLCVVGVAVAGRWVGFQVLLLTDGVAELWFTRFEPGYGILKPGHQIIEYVCDHHDRLGIRALDTMIGRNAYKLEWATSGYVVGTLLASPVQRSGMIPVLEGVNAAFEITRQLRSDVRDRLLKSVIVGRR